MQQSTLDPRRYQLKRDALRAVLQGHPWVFRGSLSSAAGVFRDGQWLRLYDGQNQIVGYGIYEAEGAVGIRLVRRGDRPPDAAWLEKQVLGALERRADLRKTTSAWRALHGENDLVPGVNFDVYGQVGVLQTYSRGTDVLGRWAAGVAARLLGLEAVLWRMPTRRAGSTREVRTLRGEVPAEVAVREAGLTYHVDPLGGQKGGFYLDLRGLRRWVLERPLAGLRVLNLFSNTCTLGLAAETAGAFEVWNVDSSEAALAFGEKHHTRRPGVQRFVEADAFHYGERLLPGEKFDLIVCDPPSMTGHSDQVPVALARYQRTY
ncbi:MAG: hypothetical protein FJX76_10540, partial [Armatimonadetes bacterium]|nr:hypothetical protein [Armatimonadota bacterium]